MVTGRAGERDRDSVGGRDRAGAGDWVSAEVKAGDRDKARDRDRDRVWTALGMEAPPPKIAGEKRKDAGGEGMDEPSRASL